MMALLFALAVVVSGGLQLAPDGEFPDYSHAGESAAVLVWVSSYTVAAKTLVGQSRKATERLVLYRPA